MSHEVTTDGVRWRDLNHNGTMEPYENPRLSAQERTEDLLSRLSIEEKVGLLFQTAIETGPEGTVLERPGQISKSPTSEVVLGKHMTHFNVHALGSARESARWSNALQALAATAPHGIPVTVSTDPRHSFAENSGASFAAAAFSQWPEPMGLTALGDPEEIRKFAEIARQEYMAVGIRAALHPQVDLATEPRWARQAQSFSENADTTSQAVIAYLEGFQGDELGTASVACVTKHFPGGGPQKDGEDAHFPYGREQVYPGNMFDQHLEPFRAAIAHGSAGIMPYYGMPVGLTLDGEPVEEVGFGYNRQILTGLLRGKLGYEGVIVSDWELVNDNFVADQVLPARAWGVEDLDSAGRMVKILDAGCDQFGGEECTELLLQLVADGRVSEERIDASARRLLLAKFQLGLFDNPFVDEDSAETIVGNAEFSAAGRAAQAASVTVLENREVAGAPILPVPVVARRVYVEGLSEVEASRLGEITDDPAQADLAIVRLPAPFEARDDLFLEAFFHQGSLEFPPGLIVRLGRIATVTPLIVEVTLDRPAVLTPLVDMCAALVVSYGTSDGALVDALTGTVTPRGVLPVSIPRTMQQVRESREDLAGDYSQPLYSAGFGLRLGSGS